MIKFICLISILFILAFYLNKTNEGFLSGTDVQLLTSKPYYTRYDYLTQARKYPYDYQTYRYPSYRYPSYGSPSYRYPSYRYPSYRYPSYRYPSYRYPSYGYPYNYYSPVLI